MVDPYQICVYWWMVMSYLITVLTKQSSNYFLLKMNKVENILTVNEKGA